MKKDKSIFVKSIHHRVPDKKINWVKCITWTVIISVTALLAYAWVIALNRF